MKNVIERIYQRTTEYSHPSQATTTANALDLLSSGIYTEEERFIFELLQNAVDSFDSLKQTSLEIKIVLTDNLLVFMHNGSAFSERDLEGLCDIGNGNKVTDAKKIGYKGIGFKSVFMHSHRVTVWSAGTCFKFDKDACEALAKSKGDEYKNVKMPWQIIPILTNTPSDINIGNFNVVTYIEISNKKLLERKVEKLLRDTRFLLFLKVDDLRISFWNNGEEILNLSKKQADDVLTLSMNGEPQNSWLIYSTEVKLTPEVKDALMHDSKTPTKLKDSESVEISFAIALDKDKNIIPLSNAVIYTYLPTSFSFGLSFIVNANFITDAGRQQIVKDCAWNEYIFAQIPKSYLKWMAESVAKKYPDWYKVLPPYSKLDNELSEAYTTALKDALYSIPFVKAVNCDMVLLQEALTDNVRLHSAIPSKTFESFVRTNVLNGTNSFSLVSPEIGEALQQLYGVANITTQHVHIILEKATDYLKNFTDEETLIFLIWLKSLSQDLNNDFKRSVSYASILPDKDSKFVAPVESFFPSEYSDENPDISADAKIIRKSLAGKFSDEMINWLKELGVQEMSNLSVIEKVLCEDNYINQENAINVLRFIFDTDKKENVFANVRQSRLENIKIQTTTGDLKYATELYLSNIYNPICKIQDTYLEDIFVSEEYPKDELEYAEWALFLKKLGCNDDIKLTKIKYGDDSWVMQEPTIKECVRLAKMKEYNTAWNGRKYYLGCAGGVCLYVMSSPLLSIHSSNQLYEFYIQFWKRIFNNAIPNKNDDYVFGSTGNGYARRAILSDSYYLSKSFIEWVVETKKLLPASNGCLYTANNILINTEYNKETFGGYFPVLALEKPLRSEWTERLPFKKELSLTEYLKVIERISEDDTKEEISANKEKINRLYERIADSYDFSVGNSNFTLVQNWGRTHKILSKEGKFESPNSLYLLSSSLSGVELDNQVFHAKHLENERFVSFMIALGVNMITNYSVEGIEDGEYMSDINNMFVQKEDFLTSVAFGESFTESTWKEEKAKMHNAIMRMEFYQTDSINIYYGYQGFSKMAYSKANKFYFVGKFGLASQELLHSDIMDALGLPKKVSTIFLAILQMKDFTELKEYIRQKGYDTSFIEEYNGINLAKNQTTAIMSGEDAAYGGLTNEEMRSSLEEAKDAILEKLSKDGFDISNKEWDGWTCINGVRKDGMEYPLVIRSNKSQRNTCLSPTDWNQLMKPNAMFAVVTNTGIGTVCLREILKSKELISIKFRSENIDNSKHISELAQVFAYFKGIQFDFESYIQPVMNQWERFMAPEQPTGELPIAVSPSVLPE